MRVQWITGNQAGTIDDLERPAAEAAITSGQAVAVDQVDVATVELVVEDPPAPPPEPTRESAGLPPLDDQGGDHGVAV